VTVCTDAGRRAHRHHHNHQDSRNPARPFRDSPGIPVERNAARKTFATESPGGALDQLYISNYAVLQMKDAIARLEGVGSVRLFGARAGGRGRLGDPADR
jgi:hypothetical protein